MWACYWPGCMLVSLSHRWCFLSWRNTSMLTGLTSLHHPTLRRAHLAWPLSRKRRWLLGKKKKKKEKNHKKTSMLYLVKFCFRLEGMKMQVRDNYLPLLHLWEQIYAGEVEPRMMVELHLLWVTWEWDMCTVSLLNLTEKLGCVLNNTDPSGTSNWRERELWRSCSLTTDLKTRKGL